MSDKVRARKQIITVIILLVVLLQPCVLFGGNLPEQRLISWFLAKKKIANIFVGTIEEVCEDKIMVSIQGHRPVPGDELLVYSYQFAKDPHIFPEIAVIRVENIIRNEMEGRVLIRGDEQIKVGDVVKFPPADYIFLQYPSGEPDLQAYQGIARLFVDNNFKIVEGPFVSGFPYGYIVKLAIHGTFLFIQVESVFDHHIFFIQSVPYKYKKEKNEEQ